MPTLSETERADFLARPHVGVLAVERSGRAPLAVPVWYDYEPGGEVVIWMMAGSVKEKWIRAAGRFTISVQHPVPPYKYVSAEGDLSGIDRATDDAVLRIATRYLGEEGGRRFLEPVAGMDGVLVRMRPEKWLSSEMDV